MVGESSVSEAVVVTTMPASAPTKPGTPTVLELSGGMVRFQWSMPVDTGGVAIAGYIASVRRVTPPATSFADLPLVSTLDTSQFGLTALVTYEIVVRARSILPSVGEGEVSDGRRFTTPAATLPSAPSGIALVGVTGGSLTISVQAPLDAGGAAIAGFGIMLRPPIVNKWIMVYRTTTNPSPMIQLAGGLAARTQYAIRVQAINAVGDRLLGSYTAVVGSKILKADGASVSNATLETLRSVLVLGVGYDVRASALAVAWCGLLS